MSEANDRLFLLNQPTPGSRANEVRSNPNTGSRANEVRSNPKALQESAGLSNPASSEFFNGGNDIF
jgi:hypothetical protein